jgi:uncharacterized membrane protein YeaQ/YmgE (transglycosylase-associated protein family)
MNKKKGINFFFAIIAIVTGSALWKQFDFATFKFEKPAMAVIYFIVVAVSAYILIKDLKTPKKD